MIYELVFQNRSNYPNNGWDVIKKSAGESSGISERLGRDINFKTMTNRSAQSIAYTEKFIAGKALVIS
jgi:hypothetical protein